MISIVILASILLLGTGYFSYGKFLARKAGLDDSRVTPAVAMNDGVDFVPAKAQLLLGQHFSAIAAAGPIVGPILAGIWFGWLPALLWIVLGSIFIGGVHDFLSLVASIRHKAASIGEIINKYMTENARILFLLFVWFALVYVVIAFTDITAHTFKIVTDDAAFGPGVAISSFLYLAIGIVMGLALYRLKMNLWLATAIFLPLVLIAIWAGPHFPDSFVMLVSQISVKQWDTILLLYCFIASLVPMWILLQPRGYLGGWLLYLTIAVSLGGGLFGGLSIRYPAVALESWHSVFNGKPILPVLFITVACGACSGFHGIVASGTTSKQLSRESDARPVGYGAMLLEGLVAVLALATVMIVAPGDPSLKSEPNLLYANGIAHYLERAGVNFNLALGFALLAFSTFVYDTLDVCTRLARYILQELIGLKTRIGAVLATFITLALPMAVLMITKEKGYLIAWPIFGTSNQLLASLTLLALSVYLVRTKKNPLFAVLPMIFMMVFTIWSLIQQIMPLALLARPLAFGAKAQPDVVIGGVVGIILLILSMWLIVESVRVLTRTHNKTHQMNT